MLQGESLLVVFLRPAGPDKLPLVFLWYHHTEISGTEKQQSGQKYQIHDIVQKNLFLRRLYEKNLTKSTRKEWGMGGFYNRSILYTWILFLWILCFVNGLASIE
jgi:hypothetical protein